MKNTTSYERYRAMCLPLILFWSFSFIIEVQAYPIKDKRSSHNTDIFRYIDVPKENSVEYIQKIITRAVADKNSVSIKGTQHSQGGHSYNKGGIILDLSGLNKIEFLLF